MITGLAIIILGAFVWAAGVFNFKWDTMVIGMVICGIGVVVALIGFIGVPP